MTDRNLSATSRPSDARIILSVSGMDCPSCASKVEKALAQIHGVSELQLDFAQQKLAFTQRGSADTSAAMAALRRLGYGVEQISDPPSA